MIKQDKLDMFTERGTYKWLPNPTIGNSIQGKNGCPNGLVVQFYKNYS